MADRSLYEQLSESQMYYDYFGVGQGANEPPEGGLHRTISAHEILIAIANPKGGEGTEFIVGRAQRLSARRDFGTEAVYEIGSMKPQEFVPLRYEGTIDLERYLVRIHDLKGVLSRIGIPFSLSHEGKLLKHSTFGFDIIVRDKYTGKVIRKYRNCVVRNCDEDIRAGAIVGETMSLFYSECQDHADIIQSPTQGTATASSGIGAGVTAGGTR